MLSDKLGRSPVVASGGVVGFLATAGTTFAIVRQGELGSMEYYVFMASMAAWGAMAAIVFGPAQALFADSIPQGQRSKWYTALHMAYLLPSMVGPAISILLFSRYGNHWTFGELRPVMLLGKAVQVDIRFTLG